MSAGPALTCAEVEDLMPELVLDVAEARERAAALEHLAGCRSCAGRVAEGLAAADEVLLAAPSAVVPPRLHSRLLAHAPRAARAPRGRRVPRLAVVACLVLAVAVAAGGVVHGVVQGVSGRPAAAPAVVALRDPTGHAVGTVVMTAGAGAELLVSYTPAQPAGPYRVRVTDGASDVLDLGLAEESGGVCTFTRRLPLAHQDVRAVRLLSPDGSPAASAVIAPAG